MKALIAGVCVLNMPYPGEASDAARGTARIAYIGVGSATSPGRGLAAFKQRLRELGWIEGRNLVIEESWGQGDTSRLLQLMAVAVKRDVDVLVTASTRGALAARKATETIPIVVMSMGDPIRAGVVHSLAHPEANLTGLSLGQAPGIAGKWVELLRELVPQLRSLAVISNPTDPLGRDIVHELNEIALKAAINMRYFEVREHKDLAHAFQVAERQTQAALVLADPLTYANQAAICALAARHRIPTMYTLLEFVDSGGLIAYSADRGLMGVRAAEYVDKILRGAKPADLPIQQPDKYSLAVNINVAKALGITIPESIMLRADEVIK